MIIECENIEQFKEIGNKIIDREKYVLYLTSDSSAILRPIVTTKGRDTIVVRNLTQSEREELERWWGKVYRVKSMMREDLFL